MLYQNAPTVYEELIDSGQPWNEPQLVNKVICEDILRRDLPSTCTLDLVTAFPRVERRVVINSRDIEVLVIECPAISKALLFHPDWNVRRIAMREFFYRARADIFEVFDAKEIEELTLWSYLLHLDVQWFDCVLSSAADMELQREVWRALISVRLASDSASIEELASLRLDQPLVISILDEVLGTEVDPSVLERGLELRKRIETGEVPG
ncbi:MAG: hypothetical protein SF028_14025 [Candidatus Sumerlaeia bacterium]|nr:hypothetical protein [Candidatus Sumerlaeia bacterium]